jgi:hypothetical protein
VSLGLCEAPCAHRLLPPFVAAMATAGGAAQTSASLRADLALLSSTTKEAAALLDLASWQLGELGRQALPMTSKTHALTRAALNIAAAKQRSEEVLEHLDASRKVGGCGGAGVHTRAATLAGRCLHACPSPISQLTLCPLRPADALPAACIGAADARCDTGGAQGAP